MQSDDLFVRKLRQPPSRSSPHKTPREAKSLIATSNSKHNGGARSLSESEFDPRDKGSGSPSAPRFKDPFILLGLAGNSQGPSAHEVKEKPPEGDPVAPRPKSFAHHDIQSILFDPFRRRESEVRKNVRSGASAASHIRTNSSPRRSLSSPEDPGDPGDGKDNELLLSCPYFRNEVGGEEAEGQKDQGWDFCSVSFLHAPLISFPVRGPNASVSVLEEARERIRDSSYFVEYQDLGALYYRKYFYGKEHQNFFGVDERLGPVAISLRRDEREGANGVQYNYRLIFRTTELKTLRGSILEEAFPSSIRPNSSRAISPKKLLENIVPEVSTQCLRLASNSPKVPETLLKLDEQGLSFQRKIGILYCRSGQSSEEEMYNNETAGPAFQEFLSLLGDEVRLKGFDKYRAQLDNKTDSTGMHSLYTRYQDYEIMFHVSTMLPFTASNSQQLLRKRHIGNDIVTIVFQEPGALPFTPQTIRSHFQHVFVVVHVHNPCTNHTSYSVAVTRTADTPLFGPPLPTTLFRRSPEFRDFLLSKAVNGENAAERGGKFLAMATRTREEYLRDLAQDHVTTTTLESCSSKLAILSLSKKRDRAGSTGTGDKGGKGTRWAYSVPPEFHSSGALVWTVKAVNISIPESIYMLGISSEMLVLVDPKKEHEGAVSFHCSCRDVLGWTYSSKGGLDLYYGRAGKLALCPIASNETEVENEINHIVKRLQVVSGGCETREIPLLRNGLGQLGFNADSGGFVIEVERFSMAETVGLCPGARLVAICGQPFCSLTPEDVRNLFLRAKKVTVTTLPPDEAGKPRRSFSELYVKSLQEQRIMRRSEGDIEKDDVTARKAETAPETRNILRTLSVQEERTEFRFNKADLAPPDIIPQPDPSKDEEIMDDTFEEPPAEMTDSDVPVREESFSPAPSTQEHHKNTPQSLEDEWQSISDLTLACNSILEAMSKEEQVQAFKNDMGAQSSLPAASGNLNDKVTELEMKLKKLQEDLRREQEGRAQLQAEVLSLKRTQEEAFTGTLPRENGAKILRGGASNCEGTTID
ncbi:signal-induced proliferation-associated protein 1 isoform X1 [Bufo bufo]|uniref:signal-induced proliferation-associated protein 1 isoform X1 n=1 Tax=Bufo bufo TaxID=8384 RepID=UPI001ABDED1E|nr:signal-induced proliferation-associated protein 1 isoform X1 [Bufo bufo]XP_040264912.1 signal-induced proliferation-associated protein 1 isoform X1 [Bufo bufo]XP_040264913.1 signal-induced proliferation-associated protein 1 isoform X1 [Bufo bufo]